MARNRAETFVQELCRRSFLTLWTHPNPSGKAGKELCDALVVCDPDIIIISVKEVEIKGDPEDPVRWERWSRRAVKSSSKQLYGAERYLASQASFTTAAGKVVQLPDTDRRNVFRLAVALGGDRKVPITPGDFGKGFIHVLDEVSTPLVLSELDTITDFVGYLTAVERLTDKTQVIVHGGEEDILAVYLAHGRSFPTDATLLLIEPDSWDSFSENPQYQRKQTANAISVLWDALIESLTADLEQGVLESGTDEEGERVLRVLAREDRFARRLLGTALDEFLKKSHSIRARMTDSPSGIRYVFLACPHGTIRANRIAELRARCLIARYLASRNCNVVGIATEQYVRNAGHSLDVLLFRADEWTHEDEEEARKVQDSTGFFRDTREQSQREDEYPDE